MDYLGGSNVIANPNEEEGRSVREGAVTMAAEMRAQEAETVKETASLLKPAEGTQSAGLP